MNQEIPTDLYCPASECPQCEKRSAFPKTELEKFIYKEGTDERVLSAWVRVFQCNECGFRYTTGDAEDARERAVMEMLGGMK